MRGTIIIADRESCCMDRLRGLLGEVGFVVHRAADGAEVLRKCRTHRPDAVILEHTLPRIDGWEVCRAIRRVSTVPIIMLTPDDDVGRIVALELGADDCVTQPFNPRELVARLQAILRRRWPDPTPGPCLTIGNISIDIACHEVRLDGQLVPLRAREFDLLFALAREAGRVLTRDALVERVWGPDYTGGNRTVDTHVALLRRKLAGAGVRIEGVRGFGYRLIPRSRCDSGTASS